MKRKTVSSMMSLALVLIFVWASPALSAVLIQCPTDNWEAEQIAGEDLDEDGYIDYQDDNVVCMHLSAGDGFTTMADGPSAETRRSRAPISRLLRPQPAWRP
jgi:hypothetical protein